MDKSYSIGDRVRIKDLVRTISLNACRSNNRGTRGYNNSFNTWRYKVKNVSDDNIIYVYGTMLVLDNSYYREININIILDE